MTRSAPTALARPGDRPRIAVVSDAVLPWNTGGKERWTHELFTRLPQRGYDVEIFTMHWWDGPRSIEVDDVRYTALCPVLPLYAGGRRSIRQALVFALASLRMLTQRFDVLHVDAIPFLPLLPLAVVARARRKPMVVAWHEFWGRDYWVEYLGRRGHLAAAVERTCLSLSTRTVAASPWTGARLREAGPPTRGVSVITPGVLLEQAREISREGARRDPRAGPPHLLFVGRLLRHKNAHVALETVARLRGQDIGVDLTVVGEGPEREVLEKLAAELGIEDSVRFRDFLPEHADLLRLMSSCDVLLFPSAREGFGMVAIEAMSVGTPVITSDHPDNMARHLVTTGVDGLVCAPEAEATAAAVLDALARWETLSAGARAASEAYDWDHLADLAARVYAF